jgi:maltooligosyltrehalose trehalohydrolase
VAVPGDRLVIFLENHDQIANGARGERLSQLAPAGACRAATALLFCAPNLPLIFMGQELAATTPFFYFTNHADPALGEAVSRGRRAEFAHFAEAEAMAAWADPQAEETFARSRIDWSCLDGAAHRAAFALHRDLIALRRRTPTLSNGRKDLTRVRCESESDRWLSVQRSDPNGSSVLLLVNFADAPRAIPVDNPRALCLALYTDAAAYGGTAAATPPAELDPTTSVVELPPESAAIYCD